MNAVRSFGFATALSIPASDIGDWIY